MAHHELFLTDFFPDSTIGVVSLAIDVLTPMANPPSRAWEILAEEGFSLTQCVSVARRAIEHKEANAKGKLREANKEILTKTLAVALVNNGLIECVRTEPHGLRIFRITEKAQFFLSLYAFFKNK